MATSHPQNDCWTCQAGLRGMAKKDGPSLLTLRKARTDAIEMCKHLNGLHIVDSPLYATTLHERRSYYQKMDTFPNKQKVLQETVQNELLCAAYWQMLESSARKNCSSFLSKHFQS